MKKQEFLDGLREALHGELPNAAVEENLRFYRDYIETEMRKGRSEKVVMEELGDPRLIARTLIDTSTMGDQWTGSGTSDYEYGTSDSSGTYEYGTSGSSGRYTYGTSGSSGRYEYGTSTGSGSLNGKKQDNRPAESNGDKTGLIIAGVLIGLLVVFCMALGLVVKLAFTYAPALLVLFVVWMVFRAFRH